MISLDYSGVNEMIKRDDKKDSSIQVYKSNKLIEARYRLNLTEQKIILYAASKIDGFKADEFKNIEMRASVFFKMIGVDENTTNHTYLKNVAKGLMTKQLEIEYSDGSWELLQWVTKSKYEAKTGVISFQFHPDLVPYLLKLEKRYKGYPLMQVMQLKSRYSIRLYELLIQYEYTKHKSLTITIEELRKKMGVKDNEYVRFDNFEDRVIKTAVVELNNDSNMRITYEKIKRGRSIHELKFKFTVDKNEYSDEIDTLQKLKDAGLAKHIDEIKEFFNDKDLAFTDYELDKAYNLVYNKLLGVKSIEDNLQLSIYHYLLYYYEYTKDKAHQNAYNYYLDCLQNDYANLKVILKYSGDPSVVKYKNSEEDN